MEWVLKKIVTQLERKNLIQKEEIEIYQFGLECELLKLVHILSYILIGVFTGELLSLIVSGCVLIYLRRKTGGYHAKTRLGCYVFSCGMVVLICWMNSRNILMSSSGMGLVVADIIILIFAPIENINRKLDSEERVHFRKHTIYLLMIVHGVMVLLYFFDKGIYYISWLKNGVILVGILMCLEMVKNINLISSNK